MRRCVGKPILLAVVVASCAAVTIFPTPALAQDDVLEGDAPAGDEEEEEEDEEEETAEEGAEPADPAAAAGDAATPTATNEETIFVVQSKPFLVAGSFEIAPQIVQSVNDRFTSHTGFVLSGIYHIKENVAFELSAGAFAWYDDVSGLRLGGRNTDLTVEIRQKERLAPEHVQLYQLTWLATGDLQWSPFYGKVSLHDAVLGQFNAYLSVGAGVVGLQLENDQIPNEFVELPGPFDTDFLPPMGVTTTVGGGLRFYFLDWLGVRFEIRDYVTPLAVLQRHVPTTTFSTFDVTNTLLAQLGVSFIF